MGKESSNLDREEVKYIHMIHMADLYIACTDNGMCQFI